MAQYDYQKALNAGYSLAEIADYIATQEKRDISPAREAGYDDFEIMSGSPEQFIQSRN